MQSADTPATRLATRLAFLAAGFVMACWAPLVPFAKANVGASEGQLGLLLLCLGLGSLIAMPLTGWIATRAGARPMVVLGGLGLVVTLPLLVMVGSPVMLALVLLVFGASLGTIDVAMNLHAVEVEKAAPQPLMSGFHGMFSLGGFIGAGGITLLLWQGMAPTAAAIVGSVLALVAVLLAWPRLLRAPGAEPPALAMPRGVVLLIAALTAVIFLAEGALLDWGALLMVDRAMAEPSQAGLGYMLFSVAMTIGRFTGDRVVAMLGDLRMLVWGGVVAVAGFVLMLLAGWMPLAMLGFILIGLGAANLVPVLFSLAGRQTIMPASLAVAAVTTTGYAGILAGPAAVGFVSHLTSLPTAFWGLAALTALIPLCARSATRGDSRGGAGAGTLTPS